MGFFILANYVFGNQKMFFDVCYWSIFKIGNGSCFRKYRGCSDIFSLKISKNKAIFWNNKYHKDTISFIFFCQYFKYYSCYMQTSKIIFAIGSVWRNPQPTHYGLSLDAAWVSFCWAVRTAVLPNRFSAENVPIHHLNEKFAASLRKRVRLVNYR